MPISFIASLVRSLHRFQNDVRAIESTIDAGRFSLSVRSVSKQYDAERITLNQVSLDINAGEFVVLVGPSGCGKSTLLRMIAGLEDITSGDIYIGNQRVNTLSPSERDVAMVFQDYALYPHKTVYDNIAFGLTVRGATQDEIETRVRAVAGQLQLSHLLQRKPAALSGGQRQRVAIGRALACHARLFLFDEPLSNLDLKLRNEMRVELKKLHQAFGITTVYVTHDQIEAMTLADRIAVLSGGNVEQYGTPDEIYHTPRTTFVATFIGSPAMNVITLDLVLHYGVRGVWLAGQFIALPSDYLPLVSEHVTVGIRPEALIRVPPSADAALARLLRQ